MQKHTTTSYQISQKSGKLTKGKVFFTSHVSLVISTIGSHMWLKFTNYRTNNFNYVQKIKLESKICNYRKHLICNGSLKSSKIYLLYKPKQCRLCNRTSTNFLWHVRLQHNFECDVTYSPNFQQQYQTTLFYTMYTNNFVLCTHLMFLHINLTTVTLR